MNKLVRKLSGRNDMETANDLHTNLHPANNTAKGFHGTANASFHAPKSMNRIFRNQHKGS